MGLKEMKVALMITLATSTWLIEIHLAREYLYAGVRLTQ